MQTGYNGSELPVKRPSGRVRLNLGTLLLVAAILVFAALIVYYIVSERKQQPAFDVTDIYGHPQVTVTPTPVPDKRPSAEREGLLPVFYSANTEENQVAITVQGFLGEDDMNALLSATLEYGADLTFFPTGKQLSGARDFWSAAALIGHEIESRGYTGNRLSDMSDADMEKELSDVEAVLRSYMGEEYQLHFLRTDDLADDENDRLHALLARKGYKGIARWAVYQPTRFEQIRPGQIIGVNLESYDVKQLTKMIRVLSENGYSMVTLNELLDYEPNIVSSGENE